MAMCFILLCTFKEMQFTNSNLNWVKYAANLDTFFGNNNAINTTFRKVRDEDYYN